MNNIEDGFDEFERPNKHSEALSSEETKGGMSAIDVVDGINRAAFRRRIDYDRPWRQNVSISNETQL